LRCRIRQLTLAGSPVNDLRRYNASFATFVAGWIEECAMTEEEWLKCTNIKKMFEGFPEAMSERKSRLFALACCYHVWHLTNDKRLLHHLDIAELVADCKVVASRYPDDVYKAAEAGAFQVLNEHRAPSLHAIALAVINAAFPTWLPSMGSNVSKMTQDAKFAHDKVTRRIGAQYQADLLRDIFGNPFRPIFADPAWLTPTAVAIATAIYADRAFDRMPILADALEEAGCTNSDVLLHCRGDGPHVRGCWVVDLLLGKE